jgi:hypothetical protein
MGGSHTSDNLRSALRLWDRALSGTVHTQTRLTLILPMFVRGNEMALVWLECDALWPL